MSSEVLEAPAATDEGQLLALAQNVCELHKARRANNPNEGFVQYDTLPEGLTYRVRINRDWISDGDEEGERPVILVLPNGQEFYYDEIVMRGECRSVVAVSTKKKWVCGKNVDRQYRSAWIETNGPVAVR